MKKIPSLYLYDPATLHRGAEQQLKGGARYTDQVTPGCEWAANGEGRATEKVDGSACLVQRVGAVSRFFKRYDAKVEPGSVILATGEAQFRLKKPLPAGFIPAQEPGNITGHYPGWLEVDAKKPEDKWHVEAWTRYLGVLDDGTYEVIGPKLQGNPYGIEGVHRRTGLPSASIRTSRAVSVCRGRAGTSRRSSRRTRSRGSCSITRMGVCAK